MTEQPVVCPAPANFDCPDANQRYLSGLTTPRQGSSCPAYCTVERTITLDPSDSTRVLSATEATCPIGYTQIGSFGYTTAIEFKAPAPSNPTYPIKSLDLYNSYAADSRYTCRLYVPTNKNDYRTETCVYVEPPAIAYNDSFIRTAIVAGTNLMINGNVGKYYDYVNQILQSTLPNYKYIYNSSSCNILAAPASITKPHYEKFFNFYGLQYCTANKSGYFLSKTAVVPRYTLCARVQSSRIAPPLQTLTPPTTP